MIWKLSRKRRDADSPVEAETADAARGTTDASDPESGSASGRPGVAGRSASEPVGGSGASPRFAVRSTAGSTRVDSVPEQEEDALPRPVLDDEPLSRADRVGEALDRWASEVARTSQGTSFLRQMRSGEHHLDLTHSHPSGLAQLLAGRGATRLSSLVREVGALADARAHARAIRETAERQAEEIGLTTCHLGIGEATWMPDGGGEPIHAPVLVRPITLRLRGNAREDVDLEIDATVDLNPVLLRSLREAGVAVDARALLATTDGAYGFDPNPVLDAFRALGEPLPGFRVTHALVVGNLMDAAGPLVEDLRTDRADWVERPLVAALAGDPEARAQLAAVQEPDGDAERIPEAELVAAVDPDHERALAHVLRGEDVALTTPPGRGSVGLVVDLMAELNARGRSVLVVSQRRANLAQIVELAADRGLEDLVFDLSPDPALQRNASGTLLGSLRRAGSFRAPEPLAESDELREARETLSGHVAAMHRVQRPWEVTAHDALSALAALTRRRPAPRTSVRLPAEVAARMVGAERAEYAAALREAAECGALSTGPEDTAWYGATITSPTQARRAEELVDQTREVLLPRIRERATGLGEGLGLRPVTTLVEVQRRLALIEQVRAVLSTVTAAVFEAPLEDLIAATADRSWRERHGVEMGAWTRRRLQREAASLLLPIADASDLHERLIRAQRVRDQWRQEGSGGRGPRVPADFEKTAALAERLQRACDELAVLLDGTPAGGELATEPFPELARRLDALAADAASLETLPRHTTVLRRLTFDGLGDLVEDLRSRRVGPDQVADELELAWWRSVLEHIAAAEPTISQYDGTSLSRLAERFRRLDVEHLERSSHRVRQASDDVLVATMKRYPDTSRAAIAELSRSSTTSVRDLAAKYEDILFRARPTWVASPYLVPQIVPRGRHFDVVIVADGGRLPTWAALPAIVRAERTVVIGDPLEYAGSDAPVLLDDMLEVAPSCALRRDPHPATGGLRAFAQRRVEGSGVLAVPSPEAVEPDRLVLVPDGRGPVLAGSEYVESTEAELRRVTDLVIEHARTRPERSLAVLTVTPEHARRLMERIMQTVAVIPMLRDFFDPESREFFTVLPAAHAAGLVRDDVIVSIGFGMTPHDRLIHRFGPLSGPAGRKALASVLTRARGRTTVVSALRPEDIDPSRVRSDGARDLLDLLTYLTTGEDPIIARPAAPADDEEQAAPGGSEAEPADGPLAEEDAGRDEPNATERADATSADQSPSTGLAEASEESPTGDPVGDVDAGEAPRADGVVEDSDDGDETTPNPREGDRAEDAALSADPAPRPMADAEPGPDEAPGARDDAETPLPDAAPDLTVAPSSRDALVADLADRLWRLGLVVEADFGLTEDRIDLALGHPDLPGRYLLAVDTDGERYVATPSQRERDRLRAERLEAAGWATERVWSWALFIDPEGEAERIRRAVERALRLAQEEEQPRSPAGVGTVRHRLPRPQIPAGHPLSYYATEDFDAVVEYICSDGRARLEEQLAADVRAFLGFEKRSVLLDVSVSSAIRRYQERL